jgi:hypothetical protein
LNAVRVRAGNAVAKVLVGLLPLFETGFVRKFGTAEFGTTAFSRYELRRVFGEQWGAKDPPYAFCSFLSRLGRLR